MYPKEGREEGQGDTDYARRFGQGVGFCDSIGYHEEVCLSKKIKTNAIPM